MAVPIKTLLIRNLLSFGESTEPIELRPLNVLIGPNGSGKSNLIETINLLAEMPRSMAAYIASNGGILHWLWKGSERPTATIEASGEIAAAKTGFDHRILFTMVGQSIQVVDEAVSLQPGLGGRRRKPVFEYEHGVPTLRSPKKKTFNLSQIDRTQSILWREQEPEITFGVDSIARLYRSFRIYQGRRLNPLEPAKLPQQADQPSDYLQPNASNLGSVLNRLTGMRSTRREIWDALKKIYEGIEDLNFIVEAGTMQVYLYEKGLTQPIPASRLSDGTFRWLCLLTVLLHPDPPPLTCIEEPEFGLHPEVIVELAELLRRASERTQLIVTTHSDMLIDALTDTPESVIVCEKHQGSTTLCRLDEERLKVWLDKYSLGRLWLRGQLGGTRW